MIHLLLIRFLAGYVKDFFQNECQKPVPYGDSLWPCRNAICEFYLRDVIGHIDFKFENGFPKALFVCPHCGFTYKRTRALPKESQYTGCFYTVDYGWKWKSAITELFTQKTPAVAIAKTLHCAKYVVVRFGVELGFYSAERQEKLKPAPAKKTMSDVDLKKYHRQRWLSALLEHPLASRSELGQKKRKNYQWLHVNDPEWLEQNLPPPRRRLTDWANRDNEYLEMFETVVSQINNLSGRPVRINMSILTKKRASQICVVKLLRANFRRRQSFWNRDWKQQHSGKSEKSCGLFKCSKNKISRLQRTKSGGQQAFHIELRKNSNHSF